MDVERMLHGEVVMRKSRSPRYKVECVLCGRTFTVPTASSPVPKHPPKGESKQPYTPYVPCPGSGQIGIPIEPVI